MIPDRSVSLYGLMQFTITVIRIHFAIMVSFIDPVSRGSGRPYHAIGVKLSRESQEKYTIFYLQNHPFLD